jgi:hypothetical protein
VATSRRAGNQRSFTKILVNDVVAAQKRVHDADNQTHRRDLVRSSFAAIEGLLWQLKQDVNAHAGRIPGGLSPHEQAAMLEETYAVDDQGNVRCIPRFLPLATNIRLVVSIVRRYRTRYNVDLTHAGWSNLKKAIDVRNRLVHPKKVRDLTVSAKELRQIASAFCWVLALNIEILQETLEFRKKLAAQLATTSPKGAARPLMNGDA